MLANGIARAFRSLFETRTNGNTWWYANNDAYLNSETYRRSSTAALNYAAVWRAMSLISGDVGKTPMNTLKRVNGGKERQDKHPLWKLLRQRPNEYMNSIDFFGYLQKSALSHGNGYGYIVRDGNRRPRALLPLSPQSVGVERIDGELIYRINEVREYGIEPRIAAASDMLHVRGMTRDDFPGIMGESVLSRARRSLSTGINAAAFTEKFFLNNARPGGIFQKDTPMRPGEDVTLREQWEKNYAGPENAHRIAFIGGMKFVPIQIPAKDAQLLELRVFENREIALWFGVPPHKLGDPNPTSYSSLEMLTQDYIDALDPWYVRFEQEFTEKLLSFPEWDSGDLLLEFDRTSLLRVDYQARTEGDAKSLQSGSVTINEVRNRNNLPPVEEGERTMVPVNFTFLDRVDDQIDAATAPPPAPVIAPPAADAPKDEPKADDAPAPKPEEKPAPERSVVRDAVRATVARELKRAAKNKKRSLSAEIAVSIEPYVRLIQASPHDVAARIESVANRIKDTGEVGTFDFGPDANVIVDQFMLDTADTAV